jgi:hypothetical protein
MATFSAKELLQRHGISYVESRKGKYTTACQNCSGSYLNVEIKKDGVVWFCQSCQQGGGETFEQGSTNLGPIKAVYDYVDESGNLLFQVLRFEPVNGAKQFRQRTGPDQEKWSIKGVRIVPFHLPEVIEAIAQDQVVFVVEGEKDVLTLARLGIVATCNPMGAGKWRREFGELLRGADVVICVDNDAPGHEHGRMVAENLIGVARRVRWLDLAPGWPEMEPSDDISDWVAAGGTALQLWAMVEDLPTSERAPSEPQLINGRDQSHRELLGPLAAFVASFTPPAYLVDGMLQRGYLYTLTARTNHGKTTLAMFMAICIDRGQPMHGREVMGGTVLFLAGENADDIRARFLVAADYYKFDIKHSKIRVIDGVIDLKASMPAIAAEAASIDNLVLVIVDTAAAYFPGDEVNSNSQQAAYARSLRELTLLRGKPTVLVNCHPVKNAARDNLLPMGGSAFLNEVDGNLTLWADDKQVVLHWQGKFRGPEFEPLAFELVRAESPNVADAKGRLMPSVVALPIADVALEAGERKRQDEENKVLWVLASNPRASFSLIAQKCEFTADGREQKTRVHRIVARLAADKLVTKHRGRYRLSGLGRKELGLKEEIAD